MKYLSLFREAFRDRQTFTIADVLHVLSKKGISDEYTYVLINHLTKKGEIKKIKRGVYTFKSDLTVVGFAYSPFYYGLAEALSLRKLSDQEVNPIVITCRKVRTGTKNFLGNNYLVKKFDRKLFFGFEMIKYYDFWIPVSNLEKTLIDFVYFRQKLSKETIKELKKQLRNDVLKSYLKKVPKWVKVRVSALLA
ncbi:type IV toxin-antitoxin system AbiEi family antitoxin domain-containing protein [Candidatus Micrarchaeota archaeon]|nr:type IV toxin-antitoxin system AbiEi family antitoxin domain-containing protein [Candidatus Micrarchaeota archaeon]